MDFQHLQHQVQTWLNTPSGRLLIRVFRVVFAGGLVGYLVHRLAQLEWSVADIPQSVGFYVLWAGMYVLLPVAETVIYHRLWGTSGRTLLPVMMRKRVYSTDVLNYSGEVYLLAWGRKNAGTSTRSVAKTIRDNTIVSSFASTLISFGFLGAMAWTGQLRIVDVLEASDGLYAILGGIVVVVILVLGIRFRRYLFSLSVGTTLFLMSVHVLRLIGVYGFQIAQWALLLPEVSMEVWFSFIAAQVIVNQIPILPNKDLIFLNVGLGLAGPVGVPEAAMAGMLVTKAVLDKLSNLIVFIWTSVSQSEPEEASHPPTLNPV